MRNFFKKYPKAKILQVGDRSFLTHAKMEAQSYARVTGQEILELDKKGYAEYEKSIKEQTSAEDTNTNK